tara:strand:+ start:146 stop:496 length:351 start_codon:yes stop_codon:yes gene_type:complete
MEKTIVVQKLKRTEADEFLIAEKYYSLLSSLNQLHLTQRDVQLLAFTAIRGNISYSSNREEFCSKYGTTSPTINNIISKLKKIKMLVKDGTKVKVAPILIMDFTKDITLQISLTHG